MGAAWGGVVKADCSGVGATFRRRGGGVGAAWGLSAAACRSRTGGCGGCT